MRFLLGLQSLLGTCHLFPVCAILLGAYAHTADGRMPDYDFGDGDAGSLMKRDGDSGRIVVAKLPLTLNGTLPVRLEIRDMMADSFKWDLFVLALSMFQSASQDDPMSWYQVAGIHGVPFAPWNDVEAVPGANQSGYCPHKSVLFPTWHRPYLALFEQEMHRLANHIATLFPNETDRRLYQQAASDFRIPYWDWSRTAPQGGEHFPSVFWTTATSQNGPNGIQRIRNPLYSYYFHPKNEEAFIWAPLNAWDETKRAPDVAVNPADPPSRNDQVNQALIAQLGVIQQRLYFVMSNYKDVTAIGKQAWTVAQNLSHWDSIESIHDIIHIYGGSKGHMTYVPLSSFDPLFLLHHTMTDRLVAMWQLLYPESWITATPAGETSYTALKGDNQDSKTPLTPFYASQDGTFWDSDMARSTEAFGYTYADVDTSFRNEQEVRDELTIKINDWYGTSSVSRKGSNGLGIADGTTDLDGDGGDAIRLDGQYTEWMANVRAYEGALGGNFEVYFFLGEAPARTEEWMLAENVIGSVVMMGRSAGPEHGADLGILVTGVAPLGDGLRRMVAAGEAAGLEANAVVPLLKEKLQVRVRVLNWEQEEVKTDEVAGLYVGICSMEVTMAEKGQAGLPTLGRTMERMQMRFWQDEM